jgi:hypothetical protein
MQFNKYARELRHEDSRFLKRTLSLGYWADVEKETVRTYLQERCRAKSFGREALYGALGAVAGIASLGMGIYAATPEFIDNLVPERFESATFPVMAGAATVAGLKMLSMYLKGRTIRKQFRQDQKEANEISMSRELLSIGIDRDRKAA